MRSLTMWWLLVLLVGLGCGDVSKTGHAPKAKGTMTPSDMPKAPNEDRAGGGKERGERKPEGNEDKANAEAARKIIYTSHLDLIVEDLERAEVGMEIALAEFKGYIAKAEQRGSPGEPRSGTWTLRVPVVQFNAFRKRLCDLGEVRRSVLDSEDITDQFYDLQARLKTNQIEEEGLRKIYLEQANKNVKLEELMAVRDRLLSVRRTIEVEQGQINRWDKETQLATIHLSMQDRKGYTPPTDPSFTTTITRTFYASLDALLAFGKGLVLFVVALGPWLPLFALLLWVIWRWLKPRART